MQRLHLQVILCLVFGISNFAAIELSLGNVPSLADEGGGHAGVDFLASEGRGLAGEELRQRGP